MVRNDGGLTVYGYCLSAMLLLLIGGLNIFSLRWLLRFNSVLTLLKITIPVIVALIILTVSFSPYQLIHPAHSSFMPYGIHGIFAAISGGGIVFAFNGFKQACEMAGEAKNPEKALPFAVIGSVVICLIIYLLLQFAFLTSIIPSNLMHGWAYLALPGGASPLTAITHQGHLDILLPTLYVGAIIGPIAAALIYAGSAARSLYEMSTSHHIPKLFQRLLHGNPIVAIIANFLLGMSLFLLYQAGIV